MKPASIIVLFVLTLWRTPCQSQWSLVHTDTLQLEVADVHFFNKDTGLVCGQISHGVGFVMKTFNGGQNWVTSPSTLVICMSMYFLNDSVGFTGGQDRITYITKDGGLTWTPFNTADFLFDYDGIHFFTDSIGIIKAYNGAICKTFDQGNIWTVTGQTHSWAASHFYDRNVNPFYFVNDSTGFVTGHGIFKTTDQGNSWVQQNADTTHYLRAITMKNAMEGYAVGNRGIYMRTYDGGTNWTVDSISNQDLRDIVFTNDSVGYCVGGGFGYFSDTTGILLITMNGGTTWTTKKISNNRLNSICMIDSTGYITGNFGKIFKHQIIPDNIPGDSVLSGSCDYRVIQFSGSGEINIEGFYDDHQMIFSIYDIYGNMVRYESPLRSRRIDISNLSAGVYIARHLSSCGYYTRKFIIMK
jgi:photosystem II stability/assembly factor-like uncharacterized protein